MKQVLAFITILGVGVALGRWGMPPSDPSAPAPAQLKTERLNSLTDTELSEYYELKDARAKYEKADELLAKMVLLLVADLGLRVSPKVAKQAEQAAMRKPEPASPSSGPSSPTHVAPTTALVHPETESPQTNTPAVTPVTAPSSLRSGSSGSLSLPTARSRDVCQQGMDTWFASGGSAKNFTVTTDPSVASPDGKPTVLVFAKPESTRPGRIELNYCLSIAEITATHVRLAIPVRADQVVSFANIHVRAVTENNELLELKTTPFKGTFPLRELTVETNLPAGATRLLAGVMIAGRGQVWIQTPRVSP